MKIFLLSNSNCILVQCPLITVLTLPSSGEFLLLHWSNGPLSLCCIVYLVNEILFPTEKIETLKAIETDQ